MYMYACTAHHQLLVHAHAPFSTYSIMYFRMHLQTTMYTGGRWELWWDMEMYNYVLWGMTQHDHVLRFSRQRPHEQTTDDESSASYDSNPECDTATTTSQQQSIERCFDRNHMTLDCHVSPIMTGRTKCSP